MLLLVLYHFVVFVVGFGLIGFSCFVHFVVLALVGVLGV